MHIPLLLTLFSAAVIPAVAQTITFSYDARGNQIVETTPGHLTDTLQVDARAFLMGPYTTGTGLMSDGLRTKNLIPLTEPYSALGYVYLNGGGGETIADPGILTTSGANAIVDWVLLELRDPYDRLKVLGARAGLLQRDGDVVDLDGVSPLKMPKLCSGAYHVVLRHRNHLGIMTQTPRGFDTWPPLQIVDFSAADVPTWGTDAQKAQPNGVRTLWGGDANRNANVKYNGSSNDRNTILSSVGLLTPNAILNNVYSPIDVNLDGQIKYNGSSNDRNTILTAVGITTPNRIVVQQLPQ